MRLSLRSGTLTHGLGLFQQPSCHVVRHLKVPCDGGGPQDVSYNTLILGLLFSVDHETEAHRREGTLLGSDQLKLAI